VKIEISDEVIKRTTKCHANFSCLNNEENPKCWYDESLCPVIKEINKDAIFVECNDNFHCNYKSFFGSDIVCNCPVRYKIYEHYKK
jgi:hypothetical protein